MKLENRRILIIQIRRASQYIGNLKKLLIPELITIVKISLALEYQLRTYFEKGNYMNDIKW